MCAILCTVSSDERWLFFSCSPCTEDDDDRVIIAPPPPTMHAAVTWPRSPLPDEAGALIKGAAMIARSLAQELGSHL